MTNIRRKQRPDPLAAPVADEATAMPASDRDVKSTDNLPRLSRDATAELNDQLGQRKAGDIPFLERISKLVEASGRAKADDEETTGRCADLVRQIAAALKVIEDTRKAVKEPYLEAGRAVDERARQVRAELERAEAGVRALMLAYARKKQEELRQAELARMREEQQRRAEEEERRKAAEEKGEPIPEPLPEPEPVREPERAPIIRGDYGATASSVKVYTGKITDWRKAFKAVEGNVAVREAVQKAINARVKAGDHNIPGVEVIEDVGLRVR